MAVRHTDVRTTREAPPEPKPDPEREKLRAELAALEAEWEELHEQLTADLRTLVQGNVGGMELVTAKHRRSKSEQLGRNIRQARLRWKHISTRRAKLALAAIRRELDALPELEAGENLWSEHERSIFRNAMKGIITPKRDD